MGHQAKRIAIVGSSISGGLAACYLKIRFPDCDVVAIQKRGAKFPVVGESLTEFSTLLLHEVGLGAYLEEKHFHKYGLTFYFKEKIEDPSSYRYAAHEAMRIPPMPSNQVNRFTLAKRLQERAVELGIRVVEGTVSDVAMGDGAPHRLTYVAESGESQTVDADWIVDASGRNRFLAKKLGLAQAPPFQRSAFWFRLENFNRSILDEMEQVKTPHHCFDSYFVTHHFLGKHNWLWAIPMRPEHDDRNLISIGIVYRPDLYPEQIHSVEAFLRCVGAEHPVVAKLVRSGTIVDTNVFRNYFYETRQSYSKQGWFLIGDAGDTVDPLYSTGMAMTSIQIKQVAAIIEADRNGTLTDELVNDLQALYKKIRNSMQYEISTMYEVMADPFQSHLRMHCASAFYFFFLLPSWLCGYITDRAGARLMMKFLDDGIGPFQSLKELLTHASARLGPRPADEIRNLYGSTVNWRLTGPNEQMLPNDYATCSWFFARIRLYALRRAGWHQWHKHLPLCAIDAAKGMLIRLLGRGGSLREAGLVRRYVGI
ncbi:halogenase [Bryobacterales bacterium F-183]|nr:halogenase [Bryobacterales bacterium F-183]